MEAMEHLLELGVSCVAGQLSVLIASDSLLNYHSHQQLSPMRKSEALLYERRCP